MAQVRSGWRSDRGAELIEFAVVMPILIFVIAGIFEFGMMFRAFESVTNAAREGARVGVLPGTTHRCADHVNQYLAASDSAHTHDHGDRPSPRDWCGKLYGEKGTRVVRLSVRRVEWLRSVLRRQLRVGQPDRGRDHAKRDSSGTLREKS